MREMWKLQESFFFDFSLLNEEINLVKWSLEGKQEKGYKVPIGSSNIQVIGVLDKSHSVVLSAVCGRDSRWKEWIGLDVKEESR